MHAQAYSDHVPELYQAGLRIHSRCRPRCRHGLAGWPFGENFAFSVGNASSGRAFLFERGNTSYAESRLVMESASKWPAAVAVAGL